jgi:enoyl-CoA hydratase/carnithine racemase
MQYQEILYSINQQVATITLNRPEKLNAWTPTMDQEVRSALEAAQQDAQVRAIVITGAGRGFCAGADMNRLASISDEGLPETPSTPGADSESESLEENYAQRFSYMLRISKPIVAAINGPVAGIGLCMALFCDLRYMAADTKLTTAFARRGLIAEHGISWMLPRLIGPMNALDLLYSARTVKTAEAAEMGLVKELPAEGFLETVQANVAELVTLSSPRSLGVIKRQVFDSLFQSLAQAWQVADEEMHKSLASEDFKEGVAHFVEKRAPRFTGR